MIYRLTLAGLIASGAAAFSAQEIKPDQLEKINAALPANTPAKVNQKKKVLVFTKTNGFRHSSIPVAVKALTLMGEKTGAFEVTHTEDESYFEADKLNTFDAVIFVNTTGDCMRPKKWPEGPERKQEAVELHETAKKNLVAFVKSGKGLAGMHAATDSYKGWKEFNDMMGGAFAGHPWGANSTVSVKILDPNHPVNAPFKKQGFDIKDEIYQFRDDTANPAERRMLLALDGEKMDLKRGRRKDGFYPISWVDTYGEGHIFYGSLGHREDIWWNPVILQHYLAGIQFALGDLEADATPIP
jgi:type 1 glutamine amidotransferase